MEIESVLAAFSRQTRLSPANVYVLAMVSREKSELTQTVQLLAHVLNIFPLFWSAWVELSKVLAEMEVSDAFAVLGRIKPHWVKNFYVASLLQESTRIQKNYEQHCYDVCYGLLAFFQESNHVLNLLALLFQNLADYENSYNFFAAIRKKDPFRTESMDIFSNILYVREQNNELGQLAISCFENDKYIPETCCVLGNYYALISEHEKAVKQFKRAIMLDYRFLEVYTLLGHEYLELKNLMSAIEAYNSAVQINPKDYRAWYGLGQAYELQGYANFAIYYFLQALSANPRDSRMWNAVGSCYHKNNKAAEAAKCFEKAEGLKDAEGISLFQLGKLYDLLGNKEKAVLCYDKNFEKRRSQGMLDKEAAESLFYITNHYKVKGDIEKARQYANYLLDFNGAERQEGLNFLDQLNECKN